MPDPPPKRRGRPKTVDRERAVELAMEHYWREGVNNLSLNEVCRRAGLSKPALYREFGGEDGLMDAVLERYERRAVEPLLEAIARDRPFAEHIERLLVGIVEAPGPAGCLFTHMRLGRIHLGAHTETRLKAMEQRRFEAFAAWVQRAVERGEAVDVSPAIAATFVDAQLSILLMQLGAGNDPAHVLAQARLAFGALLPR